VVLIENAGEGEALVFGDLLEVFGNCLSAFSRLRMIASSASSEIRMVTSCVTGVTGPVIPVTEHAEKVLFGMWAQL
jgi:hypothetical protein